MRTKIFILLPLFLLALLGCSPKKMATHVIGRISMDGMTALEREPDVPFAMDSSLPLIKTLEVLSYGNRNDAAILTLLSQAYGQYAFGFLEQELLAGDPKATDSTLRARMILFYSRGKDYGVAALKQSGCMRHAFDLPFPEFKKSLGKLGKRDVAALFWTAFNWANLINMQKDDPQAVVSLPRVQAMVDRVIELKPDSYYGSVRAFNGVIAASRPKMLGGDPERAKEEFNTAIATSPDYLMNSVLYAQYYARQIQDRGLYERTLNGVASSNPDALPEQVLANKLAIKRAKTLLDKVDEYF